MPRPSRQILQFTEESLRDHLQEAYNQLEDLRQRANKEQARVTDMLRDIKNTPVGIDKLNNLETARANAAKSIIDVYSQKRDLVRLHKDIFKELNAASKAKTGPVGAGQEAPVGELSEEEKQQMQRTIREMLEKSKKS
jgi:hypothetical protein